jgi:hypothetical protein
VRVEVPPREPVLPGRRMVLPDPVDLVELLHRRFPPERKRVHTVAHVHRGRVEGVPRGHGRHLQVTRDFLNQDETLNLAPRALGGLGDYAEGAPILAHPGGDDLLGGGPREGKGALLQAAREVVGKLRGIKSAGRFVLAYSSIM